MSSVNRLNKKTLLLPTLATLLFIYGVTSIRAAKANAQRHRDADTGGEGLSLLNESRRRHGMEGRVSGTTGGTLGELAREGKRQVFGKSGEEGEAERSGGSGTGRSVTEERLRELQGRGSGGREG